MYKTWSEHRGDEEGTFSYLLLELNLIASNIAGALTSLHDMVGTGARCSSVVRAFAHGLMGHLIDPSWVDTLSYFSFQPVLHDWCNKGCGMCYPVCGMVHIKEPLLLIKKSSPCGGSGFPLSLSELSVTICLTVNKMC